MSTMTLEQLQVIIDAQTKPYREELERVKKQTQAATDSVVKQTSRISNAFKGIKGAIVGLGIGAAIYKIGKEAISAASDLQEVQNVVDVAFGAMTGRVEQFAATAIDRFGMSELTAKRTASNYMAMSKGLGIASKEAADMAINVAGLTGDVASFFNVSQSVADTALKSIWTGETESLKQFGVVMTQANLEQFAHTQGIQADISAMTQAEQVKLRYLFVTQQLALAQGDFARTQDSWANQTRILSERFHQLLGILGNGLMQALSPALRLLNKLMATLVSFAQTIANVIGAMFGKTTAKADTGKLQQQLSDSTNAASGAQSGFNDTLDDTTKKAGSAAKATKELQRDILGFDKINKLSDKSASGSGGGTGGSGGGGGGISIPAFDLGLQEAMDTSGVEKTVAKVKKLLEDIFEPFVKSWNKYGKPIIENIKNSFNNLASIVKGIIDTVAKHWKGLMEKISSLVLSLTETATAVFEGVTILLKTIWDNGGQYLFDKFLSFVESLANLATKINDTFVKPFVYWFNDNIMPIVGKVIGFVLARVGDLFSLLSKIMDFIASNKIALTTFTTVIGTMVASWKTAQLINWMNSSRGLITVISNMKAGIKDLISSAIKKVYEEFDDANTALKKWGGTIKSAITKIADMTKALYASVKAWIAEKVARKESGSIDIAKTFSNIKDAVVNATKKIFEWIKGLIQGKTAQVASKAATDAQAVSTAALAVSEEAAAVSTGVLSKAMAFLAANPIVAVVAGIGLLVGAFALFSSSQKDTKYDIEDCSKAVQDQAEEINNLKSSLDDAKKSAKDNLNSSMAQIDATSKYIDMLNDMTDKKGYVDNIDKAKVLIEKINTIMPDTVQLTKDGRLEWQKTPKEIQKTIDALKEKAKFEANEQLYVEAIKTSTKAEQERATAQQDVNKLYREKEELMAKAAKGESIDEKRLRTLNADIETLGGVIKDTGKLSKESKKAMDYYEKQIESTGDTSKKISKTLATTYSGMTKDMVNIAKTYSGNMTDTEKELFAASLKRYTEDKANTENIANRKNDSLYKLMTASGIQLSSEQKRQLDESLKTAQNEKQELERLKGEQKVRLLKILQEQGIDMNSERGRQLQKELETAQEKGLEAGEAYINKMKKGVGSKDISPEAKKQFKSGQKVFDSPFKAKTVINGAWDVANNARLAMQRALDRNPLNATVNVTGGVVTSGISSVIKFRAAGGFPDIGEVFIARESGPEMVGSINGRPAVMNNNQIVGSVSAGVYEAVSSVFSGMKMGGGDIHLTIQLPDGTDVKKVIKDYNSLMWQTGGKGGFVL